MSQRESLGNTLRVALVLCIVCSLVVSTAAVALKDRQELNEDLDRKRNILDATGIAYDETGAPASELSVKKVNELFSRIEAKLVDLDTGDYDERTPEEIAAYDPRAAAKDPEQSIDIEEAAYNIGVKRRERVAPVYFVRDESGKIEQVVLPVYGKGLWSTLYGYLAIRSDLQTIQGLTFYDHGETPGLGGEVENPMWKAQWQGRYLYGEEGTPAAGVAKGPAPRDSRYLVDGLSGATITARGVTNLVRYWVSDDGFGPFLDKLKQEIQADQEEEPGAEAAAAGTTDTENPAVIEEPDNGEE